MFVVLKYIAKECILFVVFTAIFVPLIYFWTAIDLPVKDHVCSSPAPTVPVSKSDHRPYLWPAKRGIQRARWL